MFKACRGLAVNMEGKIMTNRMMDNRIKKLQAIEAQQKELESQAEAIRSELKAELDANGEDEHNTGSFIIRPAFFLRHLFSPAHLCVTGAAQNRQFSGFPSALSSITAAAYACSQHAYEYDSRFYCLISIFHDIPPLFSGNGYHLQPMILFYKKIPVNTSTISKFKRKVPPGRKRHGTVAHARGRDGHIGVF